MESATHSFIISSYCTFNIYVLLVRELVPNQSVRPGNHKTDSHWPAVVLVRYSSLYRKTSVRKAIQIRLCIIPPFHPRKSPKHALFSISNVGVSFILKSIQNQFSRTEIISSKQQNRTRLVRAKALAGGVVIISPSPSLVSGSAFSCARALPPSRRCRLLRQPAPSLSPSPPSSGATSPPASKYPPLLRLLAPANKLPLLLHKLNPQIQT